MLGTRHQGDLARVFVGPVGHALTAVVHRPVLVVSLGPPEAADRESSLAAVVGGTRPHEAAVAAARVAGPRTARENGLTRQERESAELARLGLSNREIPDRLSLPPPTVENHLYRIFPTLRTRSRAALHHALSALANEATLTSG